MTTMNSTHTGAPSSQASDGKEDALVAFRNAVAELMAQPSFQKQAQLLADMAEATARAHEEVVALRQDLNRAKQLAMQDFEGALEELRVKNMEIQHRVIDMKHGYEPLRQERDILREERNRLFAEVKQLRRKHHGQRTTLLKKLFWKISVMTRSMSRTARRKV